MDQGRHSARGACKMDAKDRYRAQLRQGKLHELCLCIRVHIYWIFSAFCNMGKVKPVNRRCRKVAAENAEI